MNSWLGIIKNNAHISCLHLQALVNEISTVDMYSMEKLSRPPSQKLVRTFGRIFGQSQLWTSTVNRPSSSHDNWWTSLMQIRIKVKALSLSMFHDLYNTKFTPLDEAMGELSCGVFFFGMGSCEYLTVTGTRKTECLRLRNVRFSKNDVELKDRRNPNIQFADTVSLTFEF